MLLCERMSDFVFRNVRIQATDVDRQFGPQVSSGIYAEQEVERIPAPIRHRYFRAAERGFVQVTDEIRAKVSFAHHDLLGLKPPREDFSLIVCKNVLLHFDEAQRRQVFHMFHRALRPGGLLATEHTQKMPESLGSLFEPIVGHVQVHRTVQPTHAEPPAERSIHSPHGRRRSELPSTPSTSAMPDHVTV
jgi:chemotaxis protein methyltransferase CheR